MTSVSLWFIYDYTWIGPYWRYNTAMLSASKKTDLAAEAKPVPPLKMRERRVVWEASMHETAELGALIHSVRTTVFQLSLNQFSKLAGIDRETLARIENWRTLGDSPDKYLAVNPSIASLSSIVHLWRKAAREQGCESENGRALDSAVNKATSIVAVSYPGTPLTDVGIRHYLWGPPKHLCPARTAIGARLLQAIQWGSRCEVATLARNARILLDDFAEACCSPEKLLAHPESIAIFNAAKAEALERQLPQIQVYARGVLELLAARDDAVYQQYRERLRSAKGKPLYRFVVGMDTISLSRIKRSYHSELEALAVPEPVRHKIWNDIEALTTSAAVSVTTLKSWPGHIIRLLETQGLPYHLVESACRLGSAPTGHLAYALNKGNIPSEIPLGAVIALAARSKDELIDLYSRATSEIVRRRSAKHRSELVPVAMNALWGGTEELAPVWKDSTFVAPHKRLREILEYVLQLTYPRIPSAEALYYSCQLRSKPVPNALSKLYQGNSRKSADPRLAPSWPRYESLLRAAKVQVSGSHLINWQRGFESLHPRFALLPAPTRFLKALLAQRCTTLRDFYERFTVTRSDLRSYLSSENASARSADPESVHYKLSQALIGQEQRNGRVSSHFGSFIYNLPHDEAQALHHIIRRVCCVAEVQGAPIAESWRRVQALSRSGRHLVCEPQPLSKLTLAQLFEVRFAGGLHDTWKGIRTVFTSYAQCQDDIAELIRVFPGARLQDILLS